MNNLFWFSDEQIKRIEIYFPPSRGVRRVDGKRILSGIIYVLKNGLRWCDSPMEYGSHKTLYNRFIRWSKKGIFDCIFRELVKNHEPGEELMIDAAHLKAHRTAASLLKKGILNVASVEPKAVSTPNYMRLFLQTVGR